MPSHFQMNSESESEAITSDGPISFTEPSTHIPLNEDSESDSPYTTTTSTTKQQPPPPPPQFEQRGRVRLQGGNESDGEEDRGDGGLRKPYVRSRSRTPRGATSRSRSRGPGKSTNLNQPPYVPKTALTLNSESEDPTTSASTSEAEDPSSFKGYVAQNSGSDTDAAGGGGGGGLGAPGRQGGRAEGRSEGRTGGGGGGVGGSRSRSRGRVPQYDTLLNSGSESDTVEGGVRSEREEVQGGGGRRGERTSIPMNSESEME
ncbi:hypothetical protein BDY24DRAFT_387556 [Mrakia frigida]|uniref:uncharacterized protein n=1 Tax=Mrakia frigida TaxID=29902 RepID=UPI003FCC0544